MIILRIYLIGVMSGLLFPILDSFLVERFSYYKESTDELLETNIKIYRKGPFVFKFVAALIPVLNLAWTLCIVLIIRLLIVDCCRQLRTKFIVWLAKRPVKRGFVFRTKLVKKVFPKQLHFYYECVEINNSHKVLGIITKILKVISELPDEKTEPDEQQGKD
jgi:hypothetical protein